MPPSSRSSSALQLVLPGTAPPPAPQERGCGSCQAWAPVALERHERRRFGLCALPLPGRRGAPERAYDGLLSERACCAAFRPRAS